MANCNLDELEFNELLCGCGRKARYYSLPDGKGSCNKYLRCLTYDEQSEALKAATLQLLTYRNAINQIDDYFEYRMESKRDQKKVHQILGNLTDALAT